ncbi:MAG TPA: DUF2158 domain-containing protein [Gillisia sp.]|nr:DUF2158 domain-containing protein [Gillisia sp.]
MKKELELILDEGDCVVLKSGGPPTTIRAFIDSTAVCSWFSGAELRMDRFFNHELEKSK